jgi:hypothetical protein
MSGTCGRKVEATIWGFCLPVWLLVLLGQSEATTITNYLNGNWNRWQYSLAVYAGDTVVWVNQWPQVAGTNYVESYGGEWKSPPLNSGDSFSFTFSNAGFFAYRTADTNRPGTVTVLAWTDAPPALAINTPVDGTVLALDWGTWVQASATNTADLARIEYFANSDLIGTVTNSPYEIWWGPTLQVEYVLMAKATDRQGRVTWSPPVSVVGGPQFGVWGPRLLPTGEMLFFYHAVPEQMAGCLSASDSPSFPENVCFSSNYTNVHLFDVSLPGVFVDESVRGGAVPRRFYAVVPATGGSCP